MRKWLATVVVLVGCRSGEKEDSGTRAEDSGVPDIVVEPAAIDFGVVDDAGATQALTIHNNGGAPLDLQEVFYSTTSDALAWSNLSAIRVASGDSATVTIQAAPGQPGDFAGVFDIASNDPGAPLVQVPITGTIDGPVLVASPAPLVFDATPLGCTRTRSLFIENVGTADALVTSYALDDPSGDLSVSADPLPWVIQAADTRTVPIHWQADDPDTDTAVLSLTVDGYDAPVTATIEAAPAGAERLEETFTVPAQRPVDLLFALDTSCSMHEEYTSLWATDVTDLTDPLAGLDWRVSFALDGSGCIGDDLYIDASMGTEEARTIYNAMVSLEGKDPRWTERVFTYLLEAVGRDTPGDCNDGLLRPEAELHAIGISDEPDQTPGLWTDHLATLQARKPDPADVTVHGIGSVSSCGMPFSNFVEAAEETEGSLVDICTGTWADRFAELAIGVAQPTARYPLSVPAYPDTIEVLVDGVLLAEGWTYNQAEQRIVLDAAPAREAELTVRYHALQACP